MAKSLLLINCEKYSIGFIKWIHPEPEKTGGFKLGLPVVKSIINLYGGNMEIKSIPNDKTTISIFLQENNKIV